MIGADRPISERRVLILAPTRRDAALTRTVLDRTGLPAEACDSIAGLCDRLAIGAGAVILAEEAITAEAGRPLAGWVASQPPWSDLPILVTARPGADSAAVADAIELLGNVTVLERPTRVSALVSAVRTALRARQRQYQIRDHLAAQERDVQAHALLAAIVASSDDAIISKTLEGYILSWNDGAERLFGYSAAETIGRSITMLIPRDRPDEEPQLLARLRRGERIEHYETVRVTKDGRLIDVSLTVSPIKDAYGRPVAASKVARDITQSKRAAEALRAAQEQLQVVTDNMAAAVTRCSRDLRYLWVSRGCAAWLGRPAEAIVGRRVPEVVGDEAFEAMRPQIERVLAGERVEQESQIPYANLGVRWVRTVYVPTHDPSGATDGWVDVITDTTMQHSMEAALLEADRRKDEFIAVLAHELRNPLAPIRNALHILRMTGPHHATAERVNDVLDRQVNHIVRLVDDLLEVSRITTGKIELRKGLIWIDDVIRSAVEASRPLIEAASHELIVQVPSEPLALDADPVRIAQVVANLLNNAAKYTDPGGRIWLTVRSEGATAAIAVRDTGSGISADMLPRVFDLFTQAHEARTKGGLGIGLTLVKRLVELHGGSVDARSEGPGRGSEFTIHLPVAAGRPVADAIVSANPGGLLISHRVLVVDDNRDAAQSLGMLLKLLGADVRVAYNGQDALAALASHHPAVVLLDIGMDGMDGLEVARRIRQQREYDDVTLIALTGWGKEEDRRRSERAGFDYHLIKPADLSVLQTLLTSIDSSPRRRRTRGELPRTDRLRRVT